MKHMSGQKLVCHLSSNISTVMQWIQLLTSGPNITKKPSRHLVELKLKLRSEPKLQQDVDLVAVRVWRFGRKNSKNNRGVTFDMKELD